MTLKQIGNTLLSMVFAVPSAAHQEARKTIDSLLDRISTDSVAMSENTEFLLKPSINNFGQGVCEYSNTCPFRHEIPQRIRRLAQR